MEEKAEQPVKQLNLDVLTNSAIRSGNYLIEYIEDQGDGGKLRMNAALEHLKNLTAITDALLVEVRRKPKE